jgi:hypothetical protein
LVELYKVVKPKVIAELIVTITGAHALHQITMATIVD